jgi:hypothetical protein
MSYDSNIQQLVVRLLHSINEQLDCRHWFVIRDNDGVDPKAITIRELTELDCNDYERVLLCGGLFRLGAKGLELIKKEWDALLSEVAEGGAYIHAFLPKKTMVVKLGAKNGYGFDSAKQQLKELKHKPRIQQLSVLRRELRNSLSLCTEVDSSSSDSNNESTFEAEVLRTIITSEVVEEQPSSTESQTDEQPAETHQAKSIGIELNKLSHQQIKTLQFKLASENIRRASPPNQRKLFTFDLQSWNGTYTCIPVPKQHKDTDAFKSYQSNKPYVLEFSKAAGGGDLEEGIKRVLTYLTALSFGAKERQEKYFWCY